MAEAFFAFMKLKTKHSNRHVLNFPKRIVLVNENDISDKRTSSTHARRSQFKLQSTHVPKDNTQDHAVCYQRRQNVLYPCIFQGVFPKEDLIMMNCACFFHKAAAPGPLHSACLKWFCLLLACSCCHQAFFRISENHRFKTSFFLKSVCVV